MSIIKSIERAYQLKKERGWEYIYWAIDLHATCIEANYSNTNTPTNIFPEALTPLQMLSDDPQIKLIMWTASHPEQIILYDKVFRDENIHFDYFNENPEVETQGTLTYGNYDKKFYFNVLLDDKAGFDPDTDWKLICEYLKNKNRMKEISKVQDFSLLTNKELIDIKMDIQEQLELFDPGSKDHRIRTNINIECNKEIISRFIKNKYDSTRS